MGISDEDNKDKDIKDVDVEIVNMSTDDNSQDNHDSSDSGGAGDDMSPAPSGHRGRVSRSDIIRYVIMGVALCVFIYAAVSICNRLNEYKKARDIYDDAANKVFNTTSASSDDASASESDSSWLFRGRWNRPPEQSVFLLPQTPAHSVSCERWTHVLSVSA